MPEPRTLLPLLFLLALQGSASAATFTNTTPITIPDSGAASVYPSTINVTGQQGSINNISVQLFNVGHANPEDLDILVVSPSGTASIVMSDVCGGGDVEDQLWSLHTTIQPGLSFMGAQCPSVSYKATDTGFGGPDSWPGAPAGTHLARFQDFFGEDPNGEWKLYVIDDSPGNAGDIETGWGLTFSTEQTEVNIPANGTSGPASPYPATQTVSQQTGVVADVDVVIPGIYHTRPDDIDALLVGPGG